MLAAVKKNGRLLRFASKDLKNDKVFVMNALENFDCSLYNCSKILKNDKDVVLAAVKNNSYSLQYASA